VDTFLRSFSLSEGVHRIGASSPRFLGPDLDLTSPFGKLRRIYIHNGNQVTITTTFALEPQTVPIDKIDAFNKFIDATMAQADTWFSLEAPHGKFR
jgi:hypothetical protein